MMIRKTIESDMPQMLEVYDAARRYMRREGNMLQWSDSYPSEQTVRQDMARGGSYVCLDDEGNVAGTFFFHVGDDPTYEKIYAGAWLDDRPYGVIHRIASNGRVKHLLDRVLEFCFQKVDTIRIDTHRNNATMINGLTKNGFACCGIIHIANGDERLAFQKNKRCSAANPGLAR